MNKKVIQVTIVVVLVCAFVIFLQLKTPPHSKLAFNQQSNNEQPTIYTADKIVHTLTKNQIKVKPTKDIVAKNFQIDNALPKIYTLDSDKRRNLFIYVFQNVEDRKEAEKVFEDYSIDFLSNTQYIRLGVYKTWNVLMAETLKPKSTTDLRDLKSLNINEIVFKDLNNGQVQKYTGETKHWKGTYISKYYFHEWQDKNGTTQIEQNGTGQFVMHYKPKDKTEVGEIEFQFDIGYESGRGNGVRLDQNGEFIKSTSDKNSILPTATLKWNGFTESMTFKEKTH